MLLTFGQLKLSRILNVISSCVNSSDFLSIVNEARASILNRGDWSGTIQPMYLCARGSYLTLPRCVHSIRKLNIGHRHIDVNNGWYQFVEPDFYSSFTGCDFWGDCAGLGSHHMAGLDAVGYFSTYNDLPVPSAIRVYPQLKTDVGKQITIFGNDVYGNWVITKGPNNTFTDGCTLTIASPYVESQVVFRQGAIKRVLKDVTNGIIRLYSHDPVSDMLTDLATYDPSEVSPSYARYHLNGRTHGAECCPLPVMALIKLAYVPIVNDSDLVLIDNIEALKLWCQAIRYSEQGDLQNKALYETQAIAALNRQLNNEMDDSQLAMVNATFGDTGIGHHRIF